MPPLNLSSVILTLFNVILDSPPLIVTPPLSVAVPVITIDVLFDISCWESSPPPLTNNVLSLFPLSIVIAPFDISKFTISGASLPIPSLTIFALKTFPISLFGVFISNHILILITLLSPGFRVKSLAII